MLKSIVLISERQDEDFFVIVQYVSIYASEHDWQYSLPGWENVFSGQGLHDVDPCEELVPASHTLHSEAPGFDHLPAAHSMQLSDPLWL